METSVENRAQVKEIVCDILEIDPEEISDSSLFKEDFGADSLRSIEILSALEKAFGVTIDQAEMARMVNLDGTYAVVAEAG
ncbi:acyl carrier protein [Streptomyces sp. NPDC055107]